MDRTVLTDWKFWIFVFLVLVLILWLIYGGEKQEFLGLETELKEERRVLDQIYNDDFSKMYTKMPEYKESPLGYTEIVQMSGFDEHSEEYMTMNIAPVKKPTSNRFMSKGEAECKRVLEKIFQCEFHSVRPNWLKNPETKRNLELDCYNETCKVAVEYNGKQHYVFPNGFHKKESDFFKQVRRDEYKVDCCERNGVFLIRVPWKVKIEDIEQYIYNILSKYNRLP